MKAMKAITEHSWRQPMWTEMMKRLPASITINMKTKSYAVRDNSLKYIYSDDIEESQVDELVGELANELPDANRKEFRETFSMKKLKEAWNDGRKGYALVSQEGTQMLRTDVVFGQGVHEMIVEFRFDIFDFNTMFLAGMRIANEHGAK